LRGLFGKMRWLKRLGFCFILLTIMGIGYQQWGEWRDKRAFPMPGRLIDVGGHRLHIWCIGEGSPTILMLSGGGTPSVSSYDLQTRLSKTSRVCNYDRAGLGWSDPPTQRMGLSQIGADLETLLTRSGEKGPYILVPESFGGMIALNMAARTPDQVAGIVAVDPTEPDLWYRVSGPTRESFRRSDFLWQVGWRVGVIRLLFDSQAPLWFGNMPPDLRGHFRAIWSRPMASFTNEWIDVYEQTPLHELPKAAPGLFGNKPLIVISHGQKDEWFGKEFEQGWPQAQAVWTKLSMRSEQVIASNNGHAIAQENPELVTDAVVKLVANLR
jgi:pimeloyl-ACP methyl ester carboxylesterase